MMKYNRKYVFRNSVKSILYIIIIVSVLFSFASCADYSDVKSELILSEYTDDYHDALENLKIKFITEEPERRVFECFDVSKERNVAIGYSCTTPVDPDLKKVVAVYSSNNEFLYGFTFYMRGTFHVMFESDSLVVLSRAGMKAFSLNPNGEVDYIKSIADAPESKAFLDELYSSVRIVDNYKYSAGYIPSTYTTLSVDDGQNEVILYDASDRLLWDAYYIWLVPLCFLVCILVLSIRSLINKLKG